MPLMTTSGYVFADVIAEMWTQLFAVRGPNRTFTFTTDPRIHRRDMEHGDTVQGPSWVYWEASFNFFTTDPADVYRPDALSARLSVTVTSDLDMRTNMPLSYIGAVYGPRISFVTVKVPEIDLSEFFRKLRGTKVKDRIFQPMLDRIMEFEPETAVLLDRVADYFQKLPRV